METELQWAYQNSTRQECIPVGCVPPAAVAIHGGGCLPQCMLGYTHTPQVWAWRPPPMGVGLETPRGCGPGDTPMGVDLETPQIPARHAGIPPAMHAGIPPPL